MSLHLSRNLVNALIWPVLHVVQYEFLYRTNNFVGSFIPYWFQALPPISIRILAFVFRLYSRVNRDSILGGSTDFSSRTSGPVLRTNQTPNQ